MKRLFLLACCLALSACGTYGPVPKSSLGYNSAPVSGFYGGGYSLYSNGMQHRSSAIAPYGVYEPYYFGSLHTTTFGYTPHYYRSHGLGYSSSITLGRGYDPLHSSRLFGGHRNSLRYGSRYGGHGIGHRRRH